MTVAFWETKSLEEMSQKEWESLCDGCGKCCLQKFIDDDAVEEYEVTDHIKDNEKIHYTNIVCSYLNTKKCECTQYERRTELVPIALNSLKKTLKTFSLCQTAVPIEDSMRAGGYRHGTHCLTKVRSM